MDKKEKTSNVTNHAFIGLECVYPGVKILPKLRFTMDRLILTTPDNQEKLTDLFTLINMVTDFPVTPFLKSVVMAKNIQEKVRSVTKLLSFLSNDPSFESFNLLFNHVSIDEDQSQTIGNILTKWLNDKSKESNYSYCKELMGVIQEEDLLVKVKKILDFYDFLYQNPLLKQLKKAYEHFICSGSDLQFLNFAYQFTGKDIFNQIKVVRDKYKTFPIHESFSKGQILSKIWLREAIVDLDLDCKTALVLCGWAGVLPAILLLEDLFQQVMSVDKDPQCEPVAIRFNYENHINGRFNAATRDIFDLNYDQFGLVVNKFVGKTDHFDILINTACEHIEHFDKWYQLIPKGRLVLLQSNNFFETKEHINCAGNLQEFQSMAPMDKVLFSGELPLDQYTRFMLIGYK